MPNDISQAEPEDAINPEAKVQETTTDEVSPQPEPQTEKPLTAEEYRLIAREEATRVAQSQVAKSENRTNQRIQERFAALEENRGVLKLTDEQVEQAQQQIINEEQRAAYAKPSGQPASGSQAGAPSEDVFRQNVSAVYAEINEVIAGAGVELTENDPEFKILDQALSDPKGSYAKTILAANKAAEMKAIRVKTHKDNAAARIQGGGSGMTNSTKPLSAEDKISKGLKENKWHSQTPTPQS